MGPPWTNGAVTIAVPSPFVLRSHDSSGVAAPRCTHAVRPPALVVATLVRHVTAELTELDRATATRRSPMARTRAPASVSISATRRVVEIGVRVSIAVAVWALLGKVFWGDVVHFASVTKDVGLQHLPYRDFLWEFPPLSLAPVLAAHSTGPGFPVVFTATMIGLEYGSLEILRRALPERAALVARWWHLAVLPLAAFAWFRLDFLAVVFATAGIVAIVGSRPAARWAVLGFAVKLWPAVLIVGLFVRHRLRSAWLATGASAAVVAGWWLWAPDGLGSFLAYRKGGGLQVESVLGALKLLEGAHPIVVSGAWVVGDGGWGWVDPVGLAVVAAAAALLCLWGQRRPLDPVRVCGFLTLLMLIASRILSPQYLVWAAPFVVIVAARGDRRAGLLYAVSAWLTLAILAEYDSFLGGSVALALVAVARNLLLVALAAVMISGAGDSDRAVSLP